MIDDIFVAVVSCFPWLTFLQKMFVYLSFHPESDIGICLHINKILPANDKGKKEEKYKLDYVCFISMLS